MLRESSNFSDVDIDMHLINGESTTSDAVPYSNELMAFATAVASRDEAELTSMREALLQVAGAEVLVDAAAVAGNFQRMVRIADSIGIPVDEQRMQAAQPSIDQLNLRRFSTSENTPDYNH